MKKLIRVPFLLASASPRRRRLMATFPWRVRAAPSRVTEPPLPLGVRPGAWARELARRKAAGVARRIEKGLVLGADTLVCRAGRVYGKPVSRADAARMLGELAGRWHTVYTGLALAARPGRRVWTALRATRVRMRRLTPREIRSLSSRNHDKAGAYAAQSSHARFVTGWRGDFDTIVGLPRRGVRELLARARRAGFVPAARKGGD